MAWVVIANLKGAPGDAASLAELANRPKSTVPNLPAGRNLNAMHQQEHVGWWGFTKDEVTGEPAEMGAALAMLEVIAPNSSVAVQRIHDRNTRITYERSIITPSNNSWSAWRAFAMADQTLTKRGVIGDATVSGNLNNYNTSADIGFWALWAPYNLNTPKDSRGRCTLEVLYDASGGISQRLIERESGRTWSRVYANSAWQSWMDLSKDGPLTPFVNALKQGKNRPVNIVAVGDSNTEGYGIIEGITGRWINKLSKGLNRKVGSWYGPEFPFIPARYVMSDVTTGKPVSSTGTILSGYDYGFGWRAVALTDNTSEVAFTFLGTKASVMFVKGPVTGIMDVLVDDVLVTTLDTNQAALAPSSRWDTGSLEYAYHTVKIRRNAGSPSGRSVYLEGLFTWQNNETFGVRVIDSGYTGWKMTNITDTRASYLAQAMKSIGDVELIIVNLATNDARAGDVVSDYREAALRIISWTRGNSIYAPIVFVLPFVGADHTRADIDKYGAELGRIASEFPCVHFVDMSMNMPRIPTDRSLPESQGLYYDGLHMNEQGHTAFAGHMIRELVK